MANSYTLLADLKAGRCSNTAEIRLLRFWEARNLNKNNQLMSIDMLLIDEDSTLVQGSIPASFHQTFRSRMSEGSLYRISVFDVTRSSTKYRLSDAPVAIRFNEATDFQKQLTITRQIPTEFFRFQPFDQIRGLANSGKQLPDVIGELRVLKSTITDRLPGAPRVMLTIRMASDDEVCVSLFDALAIAFHDKFAAYGKEPKIVIITSINPKIVRGRSLYLNGTSATRVFFDCETTAGKEVYNRQVLPGGGADQEGSSSKVVHAQKIEPLTIKELNDFVLTGEPQIIEFICTATITGVQLDDGWCYIGCSICPKKLQREESSFTCVSCNLPNAVAELRYRVVFSVSDATGTAAFVGFDKEVAKLTNVLASEAAQIVGIGAHAAVDTDLPRSLAAVVDRTYTFQLKLTDFNFSPNHQTFTISRIFPARQLAPNPTFAEGEGTTAAAVPDDTGAASGTTETNSGKVVMQPIAPTNPLGVLDLSGEEGFETEGNPPKKTRLG
ncbi:unnamed protein product [Eruca vesicaria subsp. sativa]|uniref:Replication factor A C-terminal domain-containing protein n=1 Tax=Eruca vesicaria subsp. sativa TaxID=29727 RepID=A0ABC8IX75_ERUVS|nr:unnamed protein product [Eruca vesicaria subsp. sativa]